MSWEGLVEGEGWLVSRGTKRNETLTLELATRVVSFSFSFLRLVVFLLAATCRR